MRHYEIVLIVKPNFDTQMRAIIERYQSLITESGGIIHRHEDWGKRSLAYPIQNHTKGHYVLMNVEVNSDVMLRINTLANTNETLLRYLVLQLDEAVTEESPMVRAEERHNSLPAHASAARARPPRDTAPETNTESDAQPESDAVDMDGDSNTAS